MNYIVFGATGWLGSKIVDLLESEGHKVKRAKSRLENASDMKREIEEFAPDRVICAAGLTGRPNVDWCESNKQETIRVNVIGTLQLVDICEKLNIHCTLFATGCIYEYDNEHAMHSGIGFTEGEKPNFSASFYSKTKAIVDQLLPNYNNVLTLRVRMPLSDEYEHPRNFITKITHYRRVVNVPNSMTVLDEMLPVAVDMAKKSVTGTFNFCNPGVISHNEILDLYREHVHSDFKYENFTLDEQAKILKAGRSNNELDVTKLLELYPSIRNIKEATHELFVRMAKKKPNNAVTPVPSN